MAKDLRQEFCEEHRQALFDAVEDILKTDNFKVRVEAGSKSGDNYIGIVYRITFSTADERRNSKLILKMAPSDEGRRAIFRVRSCFLREMYMYDVVLPYFELFETSKHIARIEGFCEYPQCYKTIDTDSIECLFLQDLSEKRSTMIDRKELTPEHILLVMKSIGKYHALSFALKDQQPEKFKELVSELNETFFKQSYFLGNIAIGLNNSAMNVIDCITDEKDTNLLKAVLKLYEKTQYETILECINDSATGRYAVITHGDMWSNNTLFRLNNEGRPKKAYLIDWQVSRYASPVLDITQYIFLSTTRDLRGRNYNRYLKTYYVSFSNHLRRLGSNPDVLFPYSALEDELRKFGKYGLAYAAFFLPVMIGKVDANKLVGEFESNENNNNASSNGLSDECQKRIRDIAADIFRLGYI